MVILWLQVSSEINFAKGLSNHRESQLPVVSLDHCRLGRLSIVLESQADSSNIGLGHGQYVVFAHWMLDAVLDVQEWAGCLQWSWQQGCRHSWLYFPMKCLFPDPV